MATNLNRPVVKLESVKPVVGKPSVHPFSKPQARPSKSKPSSHGLPWEMTAPEAWDPKIQSVDECMGHLSNTELLTIELERFGHFTVEEGHRWTQDEIDAKWARLNELKKASTQPSPAFVLNWDFKPEPKPEPKYPGVYDDEDFMALPFAYKPDPTKQIDWDAIRAQPCNRVEDSRAYNAAVNLKKRKSEEDLEEDRDAIKKKYKEMKGKIITII